MAEATRSGERILEGLNEAQVAAVTHEDEGRMVALVRGENPQILQQEIDILLLAGKQRPARPATETERSKTPNEPRRPRLTCAWAHVASSHPDQPILLIVARSAASTLCGSGAKSSDGPNRCPAPIA